MKRILFAEDDPSQQRLWRRWISSWGYELTLAGNAAEVEQLALAAPPDLLILDMRMPVSADGPMNDFAGLGALRAMRQHAALAAIPALATTAQEEYPLLQPTMVSEFFAVLMKPLDIPTFQQTIERALASAPAA